MNRLCSVMCVVGMLTTAAATAVDAQEPSVRAQIAEAESVARRGDHESAQRTLQAILSDCSDDAECIIRATTSLGWLAGRRAELEAKSDAKSAAKSAAAWGERSVSYYRRAHALRPDHRQLRANLVLALRQAGRAGEAVDLWHPVATDSADVDHLVLLGDLYRESGDVDTARGIYFQAETQRPADVELHRRLLQTYRQQPGDPAVHKEWCRRLWKVGLHALASQGLERLMASPGQPFFEWALVHWVDQKVAAGSLTEDDVTQLMADLPPEPVASRPLHQLQQLIHSRGVDSTPWWDHSPWRRHVAARVLVQQAARLEALGAPDTAVKALESARRLAPGPEQAAHDEDLRDQPAVWLEATTDLAALFRRTGREQAFGHLESELFEGKGRSYKEGDLVSIHRFHTVLGLIYADAGRWQGGHFTNAVFQLHAALQTAERLAQAEGKQPPPLPHLRVRYAQGLAEINERAGAADSYRLAAMEYLELDDAGSSLDAIGRAQQLGTDPSLRELEQIATARLALAAPDANLERLASANWLSARITSTYLPPDFAKGQQFKVYSDLATRAAEAGDAKEATALRLHALSVAPDGQHLLRADALRMQHLEPQVDDQRLATDPRHLRKKSGVDG